MSSIITNFETIGATVTEQCIPVGFPKRINTCFAKN